MTVLYVMSSGTPEQNLQQIFRVFDINNDGKISLAELKKIVKDLFTLNNDDNSDMDNQDLLVNSGQSMNLKVSFMKNICAVFSEMDENCDGEISTEEFIQVKPAAKIRDVICRIEIHIGYWYESYG